MNHPASRPAEELVRFEPVLRARARHLIGERLRHVLGPSDLMQETLLVAVRRFAEVSGQPPRQMLSWLLRTMQFRLMHHVRDHRNELVDRERVSGANEPAAGSTSVAGRMVRDEVRCSLLELIETLPEPERRVIALLYRERWTTSEIAADLGRSDGAIRALHQRAVRRLREQFDESVG